jgi:galactoside O-acetyltransferase
MQPESGPNLPFLKCGSDVRIYPFARIINPERIAVGSHVIVDDFVFIGNHERLLIGNYVHIASHASITGGGRCLIGDFAAVASGVRVLTGTDDFLGGGLTGPAIPPAYRAVTRSRVVIAPYAIIGANSVILPGVTIGEGAAVGAGSVVRRDIAPWGVYLGTPPREAKERPKDRMMQLTEDLFREHGCPPDRYLDPELLD